MPGSSESSIKPPPDSVSLSPTSNTGLSPPFPPPPSPCSSFVFESPQLIYNHDGKAWEKKIEGFAISSSLKESLWTKCDELLREECLSIAEDCRKISQNQPTEPIRKQDIVVANSFPPRSPPLQGQYTRRRIMQFSDENDRNGESSGGEMVEIPFVVLTIDGPNFLHRIGDNGKSVVDCQWCMLVGVCVRTKGSGSRCEDSHSVLELVSEVVPILKNQLAQVQHVTEVKYHAHGEVDGSQPPSDQLSGSGVTGNTFGGLSAGFESNDPSRNNAGTIPATNTEFGNEGQPGSQDTANLAQQSVLSKLTGALSLRSLIPRYFNARSFDTNTTGKEGAPYEEDRSKGTISKEESFQDPQ